MPWTPPSTYSSLGQTGYLAQIEMGAIASPPSYTALVNVRSLTTDFATTPNVDISTLLSPYNTQELYPGMIKPGPIEIECVFSGDATQLQIYTWQKGQNILNWEIVSGVKQYASTYTASGTGYITKFTVGPFENDKSIDAKVTLQITGPVTETIT
jgi:hypothetical protein